MNKLKYLLPLFSFIGFLDTTYLTIIHYQNTIPPCSVTHGCETVLTSQYATIGPIPLALLGAAFYLTILILSLLYIQTNKKNYFLGILGLSTWGLVFSLWLFYLQLEVIKASCQYCLISAATSTLLFITSTIYLTSRNKLKQKD